MVDKYKDVGVKVDVLDLNRSGTTPRSLNRCIQNVRNLVEERQPDIIHCHYPAAAVITRLSLGRRHPTPRLFQVPGPLHLEHLVPRQMDLRTAGPRDVWVASCSYTPKSLSKVRIAIVEELGCLTTAWILQNLLRRHKRPETSNPNSGCPVPLALLASVLCLCTPQRSTSANGERIKGHEDLIDAMALALADHEDLIVVFVGGTWAGAARYEQTVETYARRRLGGRAIFLGTRTDVNDLYQQFDVVVHPSHSENVGGAFESLLLRTPTITTSVGGLPELIRPGQTGWLVPPRNADALRNALLEVLSDETEARSRAERGRALVSELGDVVRTSREIATYYNRNLESSNEARSLGKTLG